MINCIYELEEPKSPRWEYPCLGVNLFDDIVLFEKAGCGTVLNGKQMGIFQTTWNMCAFRPLKSIERVILSNKD